MAAAATERCRVWPKPAAQNMKYVSEHCHGAGSSRHPTIFLVIFGELIQANVAQSSAIYCTVDLLLLGTIVLTLRIISSFLNVDSHPERGSLSMEVLPSLIRRNQSNTCVWPIPSLPYACCNYWYVSVAVFPILKQRDANTFFSTFTHRKNGYDINAHVISTTYHSQLSKRSHLQLVSWVAKTCTNMSRLVANTSHLVNNHYNSNLDTFWTNLVYYCKRKGVDLSNSTLQIKLLNPLKFNIYYCKKLRPQFEF